MTTSAPLAHSEGVGNDRLIIRDVFVDKPNGYKRAFDFHPLRKFQLDRHSITDRHKKSIITLPELRWSFDGVRVIRSLLPIMLIIQLIQQQFVLRLFLYRNL